MTRFNALTDAEKINKKPERVRVKTVQRSALLAEALKAHGVSDKRIGELATLNGMDLSERVEKGMLIKVIE
jgi:predicted Zn-dependent protease